ncbi:MAG: hypothetical protein LBE09_02090 [Christensenellaceae bacterium]|jgi:pimeloyl-ACP methyl ester carboxylesterase|nr:hypothetical protein [Christensenellaceae bacterium]
MSFIKRYLTTIVAVIVILAIVTVGMIYSILLLSKKETTKRAFIMVTPLTGGGLYDSETGEELWDPFPFDVDMSNIYLTMGKILAVQEDLDTLMGIIDPLIIGDMENSIFGKLAMDQYGNSINKNIKPSNDLDPAKTDLYYGAMGANKAMMTELSTIYGEKCDVKMFNYDWRLSNAHSADLLEEFIRENGYTEVILASHSMGGVVVSRYLSKSEENRQKVKAFLPFSAPFLGSIDALKYLEDLGGFIQALLSSVGGINYDKTTNTLNIATISIKLNPLLNYLQEFIRSCPSIIQLLPSYEFFESDQYVKDGTPGLTYNGTAITSADELYDFYTTREWAYLRDDKGNILLDSEGKQQLKPYVADLRSFHDSIYVTNSDGEKVLSTTLVDTYYIVGQGQNTLIYYSSNTDQPATLGSNLLGDGVVPLYSQIGGQTIDLVTRENRLRLFNGTHGDTGSWLVIRDTVLSILETLL